MDDMKTGRISIEISKRTLRRLDQLIRDGIFSNRSSAIEHMIGRQLGRRERLARECAKLDPTEERDLAEEGLSTRPEPDEC
jgi:Arc/MetJ-type ribon-helix-helix transcriptional regulator